MWNLIDQRTDDLPLSLGITPPRPEVSRSATLVAMRKLAVAVVAMIALAAGLILFTGDVDDEEAVRRAIEHVAQGAEAGDLGDTHETLAEDYEDSSGMDKATLRAMLLRQFARGRSLHVVVGPIDVELGEQDRAHASFEIWLAEGADGLGLWPEQSDSLHVEVELEKRDGDWLLVASDHEEIFQ